MQGMEAYKVGRRGPASTGAAQQGTGHTFPQANSVVTPELIAVLQELLQKAQQPGADQGQITQAVMQQLQQQLPPDMVMSVLQQASGLQSPQVQPDLANLSGSAMAHSASNGGFRGPSMGGLPVGSRMGTSPQGAQSPLTQASNAWNSNPPASQPFGPQRTASAGGMGQTSGLPRPGQLSPAEMMMRLQLEKQQRGDLGAGLNRPQDILGMPGNLGSRSGMPVNGMPAASAGLLGAMSSSALGPEQIASLLQNQQARGVRPDLAQMLQLQQMQVSSQSRLHLYCAISL